MLATSSSQWAKKPCNSALVNARFFGGGLVVLDVRGGVALVHHLDRVRVQPVLAGGRPLVERVGNEVAERPDRPGRSGSLSASALTATAAHQAIHRAAVPVRARGCRCSTGADLGPQMPSRGYRGGTSAVSPQAESAWCGYAAEPGPEAIHSRPAEPVALHRHRAQRRVPEPCGAEGTPPPIGRTPPIEAAASSARGMMGADGSGLDNDGPASSAKRSGVRQARRVLRMQNTLHHSSTEWVSPGAIRSWRVGGVRR